MKGSLRSHHLGVKGVGAVVGMTVVVAARDKSSPDSQVAAAQEVEDKGTLVGAAAQEVEDEGTLAGAAAHSRVAVEAQTLNLHLSQHKQNQCK